METASQSGISFQVGGGYHWRVMHELTILTRATYQFARATNVFGAIGAMVGVQYWLDSKPSSPQ